MQDRKPLVEKLPDIPQDLKDAISAVIPEDPQEEETAKEIRKVGFSFSERVKIGYTAPIVGFV